MSTPEEGQNTKALVKKHLAACEDERNWLGELHDEAVDSRSLVF